MIKGIHPCYNPDRDTMTIGKWHRVYLNGDKKISLVQLIGYGDFKWESYGYGEDYEKRYKTFNEAVKDIKRRLK